MIGVGTLTMPRTISTLSIITAALLSVLLPISPVGGFSNIDGPNGHTLGINSSLLLPVTGVLAPTHLPRQVWLSAGTKHQPVHALPGHQFPTIEVRHHRYTPELDVAHKLEPSTRRSVSDRAPPASTLFA